jgi:hypothetical protein
VRNKQHRHLALELVDRLRKVFRRLLIEIRHRLIEDQNFWFLATKGVSIAFISRLNVIFIFSLSKSKIGL